MGISIAVTETLIETKIYLIRGIKVMLDRDLAEMYGVETRALKQAVRRNIDRFPEDFMFEMTDKEFQNWRSQFVMSNSDILGWRHEPFLFYRTWSTDAVKCVKERTGGTGEYSDNESLLKDEGIAGNAQGYVVEAGGIREPDRQA